jgi:hypothetical protein
MDKLEIYLDQVCRSMGGPKALRQHVRQELREHLLDAAAQHRAAGLSAEAALDRAVADFGGPDEVRAGLEEAHGHRLLPVLIDKAIQWKERTMRAKWLWMTWAHLALALVIVLEVLWITFANVFLVPRFQRNVEIGPIDPAILERSGAAWMASFLEDLRFVGSKATWLLLLAVLVCGLFEWRVRSENKSFIRLSVWGTLAALLMVPAIVTAGSLVIPYMLASPPSARIARALAVQKIDTIDASSAAVEQALANKDWEGILTNSRQASQALDELMATATALGWLTSGQGAPTLDELQAQLKAANGCLTAARQAAINRDEMGVETALRRFREFYEPVRKAASKP